VTGGSIRINHAGVQHLDMIHLVMNRLGVTWNTEGDSIIVPQNQQLEIEPDLGNAIPEISVMPWPAFPTDLMSIAIVIATQAKGSILFHDWMYQTRMFFIDKLVGMGAQIVLCDPHRCIVIGPTQLNGERLESPDIRAGMALVIAALSAKGQSIILNISQIDRGYQQVDLKLQALGANIVRVQA
ncbi:MAG: UDP-N-acetylglucosamine 1-carboxyvinyltransferase, partial [Anaerolineales bacterium]